MPSKGNKSLNKDVLYSINSPNPWTPEIENLWLKELLGLTNREIYTLFPILKKPSNVGLRGRSNNWL